METTHTLPAGLDGSAPPPDVVRVIDLGESVTLPLWLLVKLEARVAVTAWLDAKCDEYARELGRPVYGLYYSPGSIGRELGIGESTVRNGALKWLVAERLVQLMDFIGKDGQVHTMIWCLWRFPHWLEGSALDMGLGFKARVGAYGAEVIIPDLEPEEAAFPRLAAAPEVEVHARIAPEVAPASAPKEKRGIKKQKKTTDGESSSSSDLRDGGSGGEASSPPPAPPLHPSIAAVLDAELAEDAEIRAVFVQAAPGWLARFGPVERVVTAIRETMARHRKDPAEPVQDFRAYAESLLKDWRRKGRSTPRLVKPADVGATIPASEASKAAERDAAAKAAADQQAHDDGLEAEWRGLDADAQATIKARVRADNPGLGRWGNMLHPLCLAMLESDRKAHEKALPLVPSKAPEGGPAPD